MGTVSSAKVIAIPSMEKRPEPATAVTTEAAATVSPVTSNVPKPTLEPNPTTVSLRKVVQNLLAKFTRERFITALLGGISIAALFLLWYFGTKYRLEFYIRFKNVPTPYEVYQQLTQVGLSNKYLYNIAISVRRILMGFMIAIAIGVPLGLAIGKYRRASDFFMPVVEILRPMSCHRLGSDVDHALAQQRSQHRLHHLHWRFLSDPAQHHSRRSLARWRAD